MALEPLAGGDLLEQPPIEAPGSGEVDVLEAGLDQAQLGGTQPCLEAAILALGSFAIEQQAEPVGVLEGLRFGLVAELLEGCGHAGEAELSELGQGRVDEQGRLMPKGQWK